MSRNQSNDLAAALSAATKTTWTGDGGTTREPHITREAGPFSPPLHVSRADAYNGHAIYIADGWDRWLFCERLPGPYFGAGWIDRAVADLTRWLKAAVCQTHASAEMAGEMTVRMRASWVPLPIRLPMLHAAVDARSGLLLTMRTDDCTVALAWPDGATVDLGEHRGPGMYGRAADAAKVAITGRPISEFERVCRAD